VKIILNDISQKSNQINTSLSLMTLMFSNATIKILTQPEVQFLEDSRRATTDTKVRIRRTEFLIEKINSL
jgi:hypothetical protein